MGGVEKLFSEPFKVLKTFVSGIDVLLNLQTGFGKLLVFQMDPKSKPKSRGHDGFAANPMIIVISTLVSFMEDQTNFLRKFGISAGSIGKDKAPNLKI